MSKHHFHTLLSRYRNGECTEKEKRLVEQWFSLLDGEKPNRTLEENHRIENRIWQAIQQKQQVMTPNGRVLSLFGRWGWAVAAAIILVGIWGGYQFIPMNSAPGEIGSTANRSTNGLLYKTNTTNRSMTFRLDDGTEITLSPKSSVEFPGRFEGNQREVFLKGNAFFKVAENPKKPFLVYTGDVVTKVLGTSFWVNATDNSRAVEVSVITGKVSVFQRDARNDRVSDKVKSGVILTPNQRVIYTQASRAFVTSLVEKPVLIAPDEQASAAEVPFVFDDTALNDVVEKLEKAYGIEIILENERLKNCLFTADITRQPLFTKLDLVCSALNATYEVRGTKILISGNGCQAN